MDPISQQTLVAAGKSVFAGDPVYVDDLFSAFVYDGNGTSSRQIDNGINLSDEGGLVWTKARSTSASHILGSPSMGVNKFLSSDTQLDAQTSSSTYKAFNTNGYTIGNAFQLNNSSHNYVSWTFREAERFFDVVTYSGTGSVQNISHSLGISPGMIMIHCLTGTHDWEVYHRATGATKSLHINALQSQQSDSTVWNDTTPTSSVFTVGTSSNVNQNGHNYVAFLFGHGSETFGENVNESIIECGSYVGTGSAYKEIDLGFEPQFVLFKNADGGNNWYIMDTMRGLTADGYADEYIWADNSGPAGGTSSFMYPTQTGFGFTATGGGANANGNTYIYMAIARPHKTPTAASQVFGISSHFTGDGNATRAITTGGVTADLIIQPITTGNGTCWTQRLLSGDGMGMTSNNSDANSYWQLSNWYDFTMNGYKIGGTAYTYSNQNNVTFIAYALKRAPKFFDVVTDNYPSSSAAIPHNLKVAPELIVSKVIGSNVTSWFVGSDYLANTSGWNRYMELNSNSQDSSTSTVWNQTAPTATHFTLGSYPGSSYKGIFYLFATLDGISKVGTYSGTGYNVNVDCGFTNGARFILIKRTNSSGSWYLWDSIRGINSGNDPYILINSTDAQVTNTDYIDPLSAGFTVTSSATADLNTSGGTYLFFAIA